MARHMIHTPEGVRDIYDLECAKKQAVQQQILKVFHRYGYHNIETPTFEYFDIFKKERGSVLSSEMFKFFDRDNETLVLRPDMTPAISRCVAKYFLDETMPIRLCYLERTFINSFRHQGRLKEATQTGAELIGDGTSDTDAEMIAMVIDSLRAVGLREFQVELGEAGFFRGLLEQAGMDQETEEQLRKLIVQKNFFGVEELLGNLHISQDLKDLFLKLPELFGSLDQILLAKSLTTNKKALKSIDRLERVYRILKAYRLSDYVSFDLGMLSKFQYYTGIIFKAYTYGTGDYIVNGGRYDKLLAQFGKEAPAIGFGIVVDQLLQALSRQHIEIEVESTHVLLLYDASRQEEAVTMAVDIRNTGKNLELIKKSPRKTLQEYVDFAQRNQITQMLYYRKTEKLPQVITLS